MTRRVLGLLVSVVALGLATACPAPYVSGLYLSTLEGDSIRVARTRGDRPLDVTPAEPARFILERPVTLSGERDVAVELIGNGSLSVRLLAAGKGGEPLASGSIELFRGLACQLRGAPLRYRAYRRGFVPTATGAIQAPTP